MNLTRGFSNGNTFVSGANHVTWSIFKILIAFEHASDCHMKEQRKGESIDRERRIIVTTWRPIYTIEVESLKKKTFSLAGNTSLVHPFSLNFSI